MSGVEIEQTLSNDWLLGPVVYILSETKAAYYRFSRYMWLLTALAVSHQRMELYTDNDFNHPGNLLMLDRIVDPPQIHPLSPGFETLGAQTDHPPYKVLSHASSLASQCQSWPLHKRVASRG